MVVVGGHSEVGSYVASAPAGQVVAGCLVVDEGSVGSEGDIVTVAPALEVPTTTSLESLADITSTTGAGAVLVLPGAAVNASLVRDLARQLDRSAVSLGIVHPVAPASSLRPATGLATGLGTASGTRWGTHGAVLAVRPPHTGRLPRLIKATLDRVGAVILLTLAAPLLVALWAAVRLDSRGPGLFVQTRIGLDGEPFRMFKFRSMHVDAESLLSSLLEDNESDGLLFKIRRDPRVTRVGSWLRRFSFDELPQLINVLRGEMSLVGPRPALPVEVNEYDAVARRRLVVKPGMTGLWQVSGRSDLTWEQSLLLDLYYADNWRLRDDFAIAVRTLTAVIHARGAY